MGYTHFFIDLILIFLYVSVNKEGGNGMEKTNMVNAEVLPLKHLPDGLIHPKDRTTKGQSPRIVFGGIVIPHEHPFQVALLSYTPPKNTSFCGGSLISPEWVLTAAHCFEKQTQSVFVILGAHDLRFKEPSQVFFNSTVFIQHEDYNPETILNDIALVRLPESAPLNDFIQLVKLSYENDLYTGLTGISMGWGVTLEEILHDMGILHTMDDNSGLDKTGETGRQLRFVELPVISIDECTKYPRFDKYITDKNICTLSSKGETTCTGDSGGPLLIDGKQIGIVSFGSTECLMKLPTAFTRVSKYADWISEQTKITRGCQCKLDHFLNMFTVVLIVVVNLMYLQQEL